MLCLPDGWPTRILPSPPRQGHGEEGGRARHYYFTQALKRPIHPWGQQWPCLQNFCSQEMWGWGGTSPGSVSCGVVTAGALQGRTPVCTGSPCWWRGRGSARGSPGLSPPRAGLEPGLVPHHISKASFQVGVTSVGAKPLWGSQRHIQAGKALWGIPVSPLIPRDSTAGVRGSNGVTLPCQPSFPSQQQACSHDFSPKTVSDGGWTLHGPHQCHTDRDRVCVRLPL